VIKLKVTGKQQQLPDKTGTLTAYYTAYLRFSNAGVFIFFAKNIIASVKPFLKQALKNHKSLAGSFRVIKFSLQ